MPFKKLLEWITKQIEKVSKRSEKRILKRYKQTLTEMESVLGKYYRQFEDSNGKLDLQTMLRYDRLTKLKKELNKLLVKQRKDIEKVIEDNVKESYSEGYYLTAWALERFTRAKLDYRTVTPETLTAMLDNPVAGLTLNERLERNRHAIIYTIQQEITQGLHNAETFGTMAKRLKRSLEGDAVKAMRIARTEGHRVQEKAKYDAVVHSNKKGVITLKEWNTMEDRRVRRRPRDKANHKKLNEVQKPMDQNFSDGLSSGPAPGLLLAAASSINCRCFLTYSIQRVEKPQYEELENMAFDKWKKERLRTT